MTSFWRTRRFIAPLSLFAAIAILPFALYVVAVLHGGEGNFLMPLDDVYIHFQYAKQLAQGQPNVYNPGQSATSGATSFLYPFILALGWRLGFQELLLGLWAMLVGVLALLAAMWAVFRLSENGGLPRWLALLFAIFFCLSGSINWHFFSGMETGLMVAFTLWVLLTVVEKRVWLFVGAATLLTLTRPEGGILAAIAAAIMFLRLWQHRDRKIHLLWLVLPVLALGVQPAVNWLVTGSSVATGNQAKSILATVPRDWAAIIPQVLQNFARMWAEFFTGYGQEGWFLAPLLALIAMITAVLLLFRPGWRLIGLMLLGWFLSVTAAVSTLDTAFWHFKRYQMPLIALFFPLAAWGLAWMLNRLQKSPLRFAPEAYLLAVLPAFSLALLAQFWGFHHTNVNYVYEQPYQMALWLRENTPRGAVIAVHDVGLMRYMGERTTLDMVGLTTPGAAGYWRNGPGSVAEFLIQRQPDYIASYGYGHGYGLAYLADTAVYGEPLEIFTIDDWQRWSNVALAADSQAIYQPDWETIVAAHDVQQCSSDPEAVVWSLQVAELASEGAANYHWDTRIGAGFVSEVRQVGDVVDGYRLINREESFMPELSSEDVSSALVLSTRVHAATAGAITVFVDEQAISTRWIPAIPGEWFLIETLIPAQLVHEQMQIRIVPAMPDGFYMPACHTLRIAEEESLPEVDPLAVYQGGAFVLVMAERCEDCQEYSLVLNVAFQAELATAGDYRFFVHLYDNANLPPVAQWDGYFSGMPVGNWLPGIIQQDIVLPTSDLPAGEYQLAIGFYNPNDPTDRLLPMSDEYTTTEDGRLWLENVRIGGR